MAYTYLYRANEVLHSVVRPSAPWLRFTQDRNAVETSNLDLAYWAVLTFPIIGLCKETEQQLKNEVSLFNVDCISYCHSVSANKQINNSFADSSRIQNSLRICTVSVRWHVLSRDDVTIISSWYHRTTLTSRLPAHRSCSVGRVTRVWVIFCHQSVFCRKTILHLRPMATSSTHGSGESWVIYFLSYITLWRFASSRSRHVICRGLLRASWFLIPDWYGRLRKLCIILVILCDNEFDEKWL